MSDADIKSLDGQCVLHHFFLLDLLSMYIFWGKPDWTTKMQSKGAKIQRQTKERGYEGEGAIAVSPVQHLCFSPYQIPKTTDVTW